MSSVLERYQEFFEGENNRLSMARLGFLICCLVSSGLIIADTVYNQELNGNAFMVYSGVFSGTYAILKGIDKLPMQKAGKK